MTKKKRFRVLRSPDFSGMLQKLNPVWNLSSAFSWIKEAQETGGILLTTFRSLVVLGVSMAGFFTVTLLLGNLAQSGLGALFSDILDINDDASISWWEPFTIPLGIPIWFFWTVTGVIIFSLSKSKGLIDKYLPTTDGADLNINQNITNWMNEKLTATVQGLASVIPSRTESSGNRTNLLWVIPATLGATWRVITWPFWGFWIFLEKLFNFKFSLQGTSTGFRKYLSNITNLFRGVTTKSTTLGVGSGYTTDVDGSGGSTLNETELPKDNRLSFTNK